jgi:hypothetical protein
MKKVKLTVNGAYIDDYDEMSYVCYRNHQLDAGKRYAYERAVGQEQKEKGLTYNISAGTREKKTFLAGA